MKNQSELFTFHRYKKKEGDLQVRHPKLIVDEENNNWGYMGLTEQKKKGKNHYNIPLSKNPKKGDTRPAYLRKQINYADKKKFEKRLSNYKLSQKDLNYIYDYVEKHKKR